MAVVSKVLYPDVVVSKGCSVASRILKAQMLMIKTLRVHDLLCFFDGYLIRLGYKNDIAIIEC
ncbi:hypothetical protein QWZ13_01700 [Reinekea marina]|uniref:hypothetical protein n=1 Tax=Reinekea marina TaxID=1310421 RepID=UPI0025B33E46|nr:hypothetical protein [Reinekea marina]MDN3647619.1 hypothetical protein [Reinekea marina]